LPQPVQRRLGSGYQTPLQHLSGCGVQARAHDRPYVHVQPNTRTLRKHRGLPQMSALPARPALAGNPRQLASEASARSTGLLIPSGRTRHAWGSAPTVRYGDRTRLIALPRSTPQNGSPPAPPGAGRRRGGIHSAYPPEERSP
jgi:hypothetical protein